MGRSWQIAQLFEVISMTMTRTPLSVLDAIKQGIWDFEPETQPESSHDRTTAMPGTDEKVEILAGRLRKGLPLWHPGDRRSFDDLDVE